MRCAGQLRFAPSGVVLGVDYPAAFAVAGALGYDAAGIALLLPSADAGMVAGLSDGADGGDG